MAASITDYVIKLQELTQKNLDILQTLNDSFFTNQNHLSVRVGDNQYAIPSFISLENKINSLTANFENLVNAPETGEAFFDFNGNSRAINVRSYTSTPNSLVLDPITDFGVEQNDIFKDFLTPCPYIHLNVLSLPNDTTQVLVKKVIPTNKELKNIFKSYLEDIMDDKIIYKTSAQYSYKDLYKILDQYKQDVDYVEYDTRMDLPIRKNVGSGTYVIEEVVEDIVDENLDNFITLKFRTDVNDPTIMSTLKYRLFDETIEKMLKVGDQLVTFEGNAKMEVTEIRPNTNTIIVKVLHGEFLNLVPSTTNNPLYISPLSKVKFYSPIDFNEDKYIRVPLEEDQYVFVAVAALNSRMNVQSSWGGGLMINTFILKNGDKDFKTYYEENVRNVGDVLFEITSMMSNTLTKYTKDEYDEFTQYIPEINVDNLIVTQINKHLNDSVAVKNIRSLYSQKIELQSQLTEIQNQLNVRNEELSTVSFDDTTGQRSVITSTIQQLNVKKNELYTAITKIMDEISTSANNSEVPIENAKYRIRGFFDTSNIKWYDHIVGIRVQYRYKNVNVSQNQALTINDKFVFSDWNEMTSNDRERIPIYVDGSYKSTITPYTDKVNEPSFNQIDIPISQGETVDIRLKVIYDFGAPFVQTSSKWSPITNIAFPAEYLKDIKILDIIEENNNDIEANRFNNIIKEEGIPTHISDKVTDQDITYFHKSESIASGFYTAERRIIPLKDKLAEINNLIIQLQDEVLGSQSDQLTVSVKQGNNENKLVSFADNYIYTDAYQRLTLNENNKVVGNYEYDANSGMATTIFYLSLRNDSNHVVNLYPLFPKTTAPLNEIKISKFSTSGFCDEKEGAGCVSLISTSNSGGQTTYTTMDVYNYLGVWIECPSFNINEITKDMILNWPGRESMANDTTTTFAPQTGNQFIYFRTKDIYTDNKYLDSFGKVEYNTSREGSGSPYINFTPIGDTQARNMLSSGIKLTIGSAAGNWPHISKVSEYMHYNTPKYKFIKYEGEWGVNSNKTSMEDVLGEALMFVYPKLNDRNGLLVRNSKYEVLNPGDEIMIPIVVEFKVTSAVSIQKTISFDIQTSLYKDPTNYSITFVSKYDDSEQDRIMAAQQSEYNSTNTKYNVIYK